MKKVLLTLPVLIAAGFFATSARADDAVSNDLTAAASDVKNATSDLKSALSKIAPATTGIKVSGSAEGVVTGVNHQMGVNQKKMPVTASANATLTLDGKHNFAGDTKIIWKASTKFDTAGAGRFDGLGNEEASVGMTGPWGTITVGKEKALAYKVLDDLTTIGMDDLFSSIGIAGVRYNNAIKYQSPEMFGLKAAVQTTLDFQKHSVIDAVISYNPIQDLNINLGVSATKRGMFKNNASMMTPEVFNSVGTDAATQVDTTLIFATAAYQAAIDDMNTIGGTLGLKVNNQKVKDVKSKQTVQALGTVFYKIETYKVSLGYQYLSKSTVVNNEFSPAIHGVYAELSDNVYKNTNLYVRAGVLMFNNKNDSKNNVSSASKTFPVLNGADTTAVKNVLSVKLGVTVDF